MRRVVIWVTAGLVAAVGLAAVAAAETSNVLVLYSNGRLIPGNVEGDRGLHRTVRAPADRPVTLFYEFLDAPRFGGPAFDQMVGRVPARQICVSAAPRDRRGAGGSAGLPAASSPGALCAGPGCPRGHRQAVAALDLAAPRRRDRRPGPSTTSPATIDLALRWHPRARRLVIVTGAAEPDRALEAQLRTEVSSVRDRATAEFLAGLPTRESAEAPRRARRRRRRLHARLLPGRRGPRPSRPRESVRAMAAASPRARLRPFNTFIGTGIVGGYMPSFEAIGTAGGRDRERAARRRRRPLAAPAGDHAARR